MLHKSTISQICRQVAQTCKIIEGLASEENDSEDNSYSALCDDIMIDELAHVQALTLALTDWMTDKQEETGNNFSAVSNDSSKTGNSDGNGGEATCRQH